MPCAPSRLSSVTRPLRAFRAFDPGLLTLGARTPFQDPTSLPPFPPVLLSRPRRSFEFLHPVGGVVPIPFRWQPALTPSFRTLLPTPSLALVPPPHHQNPTWFRPSAAALALSGVNRPEPNPPRTLQYSCGSIFFYICSIASHRTLLLSLSMNLQQLKKLCCWMEWQRKQK